MSKESAGILAYRWRDGLEVFLVHPGGPYWARKDLGAWSIPKGEIGSEEEGLDAARREFLEETGFEPRGRFLRLKPVRQAGGKRVHAWAVEMDMDPERLRSNTFSMQWPPKSGRYQEFPEVDRAGWFSPDEARERINPQQSRLIDDLQSRLTGSEKNGS